MDFKSPQKHKRATTQDFNRKDGLKKDDDDGVLAATAATAPCFVCGAQAAEQYIDSKSTNNINRPTDVKIQTKSFCSACKNFYQNSTIGDAHLTYVCITQSQINRRISLRNSNLLTSKSPVTGLCIIKTDIVNKCRACWYLKCISFGLNEILEIADGSQSEHRKNQSLSINNNNKDPSDDIIRNKNDSRSSEKESQNPNLFASSSESSSVDVATKNKQTQRQQHQPVRSDSSEKTAISQTKPKLSTVQKQLAGSTQMDNSHNTKSSVQGNGPSVSTVSSGVASLQLAQGKSIKVFNQQQKSMKQLKSVARTQEMTKTTTVQLQTKTSVSNQTKSSFTREITNNPASSKESQK